MSAKPRSLLKLDQAYIAVGAGWAGTLISERPTSYHPEHLSQRDRHHIIPWTSCAPLRFESPPQRGAEVPSSTQSGPTVSPVGINQDAHRLDSRIPLGPRTPRPEHEQNSRRSEDMYPHGMPNIQNGRETSPRISLPPLAGLLMAPPTVCVFTRWFTAA